MSGDGTLREDVENTENVLLKVFVPTSASAVVRAPGRARRWVLSCRRVDSIRTSASAEQVGTIRNRRHDMHNVLVQKASELPQRLKSAVEELLGRPNDADEEISIVAVPPHRIPPFEENRSAVAQSLEAFLNRRAEKTQDVSDREIDAAVDEAADHVRHSRG